MEAGRGGQTSFIHGRVEKMSVRPARYDATIQVCCFSRLFIRPGFGKQWLPRQRQLESGLARYRSEGMNGLADRSSRPKRCPQATCAEQCQHFEQLCRHWRPRAQSQQGHWVRCTWPSTTIRGCPSRKCFPTKQPSAACSSCVKRYSPGVRSLRDWAYAQP